MAEPREDKSPNLRGHLTCPSLAPDPAVARSDMQLVASDDNLQFLQRYLKMAYPTLSRQDVEDIAVNVIARLIDRIKSGKWKPVPDQRQINSYLKTGANWAVLDFFRLARRAHEQTVPNEAMRDLVLTDDDAVAALDRAVTTDGVRAALAQIHLSGDVTLFRVVTCLLDEIQRTGERPSNRQIASACGVSHTAVAKALVRLRPYFARVRDTARES
jgi:DNA-directed RNA polymerase specialized sigma24 family protein